MQVLSLLSVSSVPTFLCTLTRSRNPILELMFSSLFFRQRCVLRRCANRNKKIKEKIQKPTIKQVKLNSKQLPPPPERDKIETISLSESQTETELSTQTEFSIENLESGMVQIHDPDNILGGFPSTAEAQPDTIQLSRANSPVTHEDTEAEEVNTSSPVKKLKMFSCPNCGKLFSRKIYAINHCKPKEPWRCTKCFQEINQVQNIKRHIER